MSPQATQEQLDAARAFLLKKEEDRVKRSKGLLPGRPPSLPKITSPMATPELTKPIAPEKPKAFDPKDHIANAKAFLQSKIGGGPGFEKIPDPSPKPLMRPEGPRVKPYISGDIKSEAQMFLQNKNLESKGYKPVKVEGDTFTERAISFARGQSKATRKLSGPDDIGTMRHMSSSFLLGATNMIAAMPEYVAIAAKYLEDATGLFDRDEDIEDRALYKLGQAMRQAAIEWFPQSEELADSFLYTTLPQGAGSLAAFMALGIAGKAAKIPAWLAPLVGGATMESANMYLEAKHHGATEDEAFGAWLGGHLAGGLEAVPVGRALARFDKLSGGGIKKILANGFVGGVEELAQEVAQTMTENYVAKLTFDEQRELMSGTFEAGGAGGILGGVANMILAAAGLKMRGGGLTVTNRPTEEELSEMDGVVRRAWETFYAAEERLEEDMKSDKYSEEDMKEAKTKLADVFKEEFELSAGERAGGVTTQMKKDASKENVEARAEELAEGRKKPEARDKTEDTIVEVVDVEKVDKKTKEEALPSDKEAKDAIDADIAKQEELLDPDLQGIRDKFGAGSLTEEEAAQQDEAIKAEEAAVAPEGIAAATEEIPTEEAAPWVPGQPLPGEPTPQGETPLMDQVANAITEADTAVSEGVDVSDALKRLDFVGRDLNDEIMRGDVSDETQDAMEAVSDKMDELSEIMAAQITYPAFPATETRKDRRARLTEQNKLKIKNQQRLAELEETRTKKMEEDSRFIRDLAVEGRKFVTRKVQEAQEPGTRQTGRVGAVWGVYENKKLVAHMQGKESTWEVYEPVKGNKDRLINRTFESRQEAFHAAVRLLAEPSTEVESADQIQKREEETRARLKSEKDKRRNKNFYIISRDGQVYAMKRGQYREWLEIGASGKDNSDMSKTQSKPIQKWAKHIEAKPEDVSAKDHLEEAIGKPALSLEEADSSTFKEELRALDAEEKEAGWYKDPIPDGVDPEAHARAYKYYDVGTIEYELALRGGIEFPRNAKGKLTQEGKDMLLQNRGAKTDARQPDYADPIYVSEENSKGGGSAGDIENIGDELIGAKLLAEGTSLTHLLTGRVRGKKDEGGYRGHPTLEKQNELADEANEKMAVEQSEEGRKRAEVEAVAEQTGFDLELQDRVRAVYNKAAQEEPEAAIETLSEIEVYLSDYIDNAIENGYDYDDANSYRESVRAFIGVKEESRSRGKEEKAKEIAETDTDEVVSEEALDILVKFEKAGSKNAPSISPGERRRIVELGFADEMTGPRGTRDAVLNDKGREVIGQIRAEQRDDAEQIAMNEVENIERENKIAQLKADEEKLADLQRVKIEDSLAGHKFAEERGNIEQDLADSIKRQKEELIPTATEQKSLFGVAKKRDAEEEDGGGSLGGYYAQKTLLEEGPSAQVVPSRADVDSPPDTPSPPPEDVPPPPDEPPGDEGKKSPLQEARDAQVMPDDLKKAREEEDSMTLPERVRNLVVKLQTALTSQYTPLREAQRDIYNVAGEPMPTMDAATMAEINAGMDGKAWAEFLPFREEVIDQIKGDYMEFNTYIFLLRTQSRLEDDPKRKKVGSWTIGKAQDALDMMREENGDEKMTHFAAIAEKYQEHTDKMLDSIFATGMIDADAYDKIKEANDFYALFKVAKHFKSWDDRLEGGGNITNDFKLLHAITGIQEEDVEAAQIVDIVGQTAKAIYNTKIRTEKQLFKLYLWEMASMDENQKYFVQGRPDQYYIKQFKTAEQILEQYGLQRLAQNRQLIEPQMIKVGFGIEIAESLGLRVDKKRLRKALGSADIGGVDEGGRINLNAFISEVIVHELGHSFDIARIDPKTGETMVAAKNVFGREKMVVQKLSGYINKKVAFKEELAGLVKMTKLGGSKKYRHSAVERWAEFINVYVHNPALARKIAPKWTTFFETEIMKKDKRLSSTIEKLSEFYVRIDKLPNILTKLEELGGNSYFETAVRKAFPDSPKLLVLAKGTEIPEGFRRILLRVEGKQRALDVREDIYKAVEDQTAYRGAIAMKFFGKAGQILRGGATIYNATFMVKNFIFRDPVRLMLLSKYGINFKNPNAHEIFRFPLDWLEAVRSAWRGNFGTPDALYMRWLKSGAGFTDMQSLMVAETLFEDKSKKNLMNTVAKFAAALEQATKLLGFKRALRMEKFDQLPPDLQQNKLNEIAAEIRRYAGSPDFWRHGMKVKGQASLMFMFLNARIQGVSADLARLGSSSRGYRSEAWVNLAVGVGLPTLGLALLNYHDDEDREYYEKQNKIERHNYYMIPKGSYYLDDNGDKRQEYWTIPKDDTAKIFSAMVESFVKFWKDEDPAAFSEFFFGFFEDISPIGISGDTFKEKVESAASSLNPVLKTPFEWMAGRNFYYHTDVIPRRMENYAPEDQKRSTTPEIFVGIGKMTGQSPLMLEHLTRNITASGLTQFAPLWDVVTGKLKVQEGRGIETALPVIKMFSSSSYGGTEDQLERLVTIRSAEGEELGKKFWEVESRFNEMQNMKPSQFSREIREIAKRDRELAKKLRERRKKHAMGWNFMDGMVQSLGVGSGARARYLYGELRQLDTKIERDLYIKELRKKRLLTAQVYQQIKELERTGGAEWRRRSRR